MSRDSSRTHIHLQKSKHADLFEEFTSNVPVAAWLSSAGTVSSFHHPLHPAYALYHPTSQSAATSSAQSSSTNNISQRELSTLTSSSAQAPHPLLPAEEILIPQSLLPPNPEDDDDVVPDQHAAFGIAAAMPSAGGGSGGRQKTFEERLKQGETWRDFGTLRDVVAGADLESTDRFGGNGILSGQGNSRSGGRREMPR